MSDPPRQDHSVRDLLRELFPETHREVFGTETSGTPPTLGLYPVADGRLALVHGGQLAELTPLDPKGQNALHCDLCHFTRSRAEAAVFRVQVGRRVSRYVTLCVGTQSCQRRAGQRGLETLSGRIFPVEPLYVDEH